MYLDEQFVLNLGQFTFSEFLFLAIRQCINEKVLALKERQLRLFFAEGRELGRKTNLVKKSHFNVLNKQIHSLCLHNVWLN